ncbi:MAG: hypothetical protein U1D30_24035 [Planctomycetota bacterium]
MDLFQQETLLSGAKEAVRELAVRGGELFSGLVIVGVPLRVQGRLYNTAAVLHAGEILAIIPKRHLPTYREFYETVVHVGASDDDPEAIDLGDGEIPFKR